MAFFKPEFINRVDEIIRFRALTEADLGAIVGQLAHLRDRLAEARIGLEVARGDGAAGARGLRPRLRCANRSSG